MHVELHLNVLDSKLFVYAGLKVIILLLNCVVPENIHTPPTEGIGGGGFPKTKTFKEMYEVELEFPEGWEALIKNPFCERYGYFMELHIQRQFSCRVKKVFLLSVL